jgi:hypothetical protein
MGMQVLSDYEQVRQQLQTTIQKLPPGGARGFEGMAATLLECLTGKPFFVAATGFQPLGDASSIDTRISLQAKRYSSKTKLDASQIAADFLRVVKAAPTIDLYVVAAPRETSQLRQELETYQESTGVDILILEESMDHPELTSLCIQYWSRISSFFPTNSRLSDDRICQYASNDNVRRTIDRVRAKFTENLYSLTRLRELTRSRLKREFEGGVSSVTIPGHRISLIASVDRTGPGTLLRDWWTDGKNPVGYIQGEEGCGKSYIAAAFASALCNRADGPPVFWLQSREWSGCESLDSLVCEALNTVFAAGEEAIVRYKRRILGIWTKAVLIVLDGVNQHESAHHAQRLLNQYNRHGGQYSHRFSTTAVDATGGSIR